MTARPEVPLLRTWSAAELDRRWPGALRPVVLPDPGPALPGECRELLTAWGLPAMLVLHGYNDTTLRFGGRARPLASIWQRDLGRGLMLGEMPADWSRFWHLGDEAYLQGGGWVCLEEPSGRLVVIDPDAAPPVFTFHSELRHLYTTLGHLLTWSELTDGNPQQTRQLRDLLRTSAVLPAGELEPFWLNFIEATLDGDPLRFAVTLGEPPVAA